MTNNFGGLMKSLNDLANHYEDIAKQAGMTDAEHWAAHKRDTAGAPPPYALPPFVMYICSPALDGNKVEAEAQGLYKNRSPWGFLVNEVFRDFPPATTQDEVMITRPQANMSAFVYAGELINLRIRAEEQADFPNNLDKKQRARIRALDPTGEKTARARERQAASAAVHQKVFDDYSNARQSIRDAVLAKVSGEDALDTLLQSGTDLFNLLYTTMYDLTEASDVGFGTKDLKGLWDEIMDGIDGLTDHLLGPDRDATAEGKPSRLDDLWVNLLKVVRQTGHLVVTRPHHFANNVTPERAKVAWDGFVKGWEELLDALSPIGTAEAASTKKSALNSLAALKWANPTGNSLRKCDDEGCGYFHAKRTEGNHEGIDFISLPGQTVVSPTDGTYSRSMFTTRIDPITKKNLTGIEIEISPNIYVQVLYVHPASFQPGQPIKAGDPIGKAWDILPAYGNKMTNHVHVEIEDRSQEPKQFINPTPLIPGK